MVDRVIRLAAEKPSISCLEKEPTLSKSMLRSLLHSEDDTLAARTTVPRAAATLANAHRSMRSPSLTTTSVAVPACRWSVIPLMYSGMRRSR